MGQTLVEHISRPTGRQTDSLLVTVNNIENITIVIEAIGKSQKGTTSTNTKHL